MFVMTNDGGVPIPENNPSEVQLLQRVFIYDILAQGISVALLQGAEYRDSKVCLQCPPIASSAMGWIDCVSVPI